MRRTVQFVLALGRVRLIRVQVNLGMCLLRQKRYPEAEALLHEAIEGARTHGLEENADALNAPGALAAMLNEQAKYDEAVPLLEAHLETQRRILGPEHPQSLITQANLAFSHLHAGRLDVAEPLIAPTLDARLRLLGEAHPHTLISLAQQALLRKKPERLEEAEALLRRGVELTQDNPSISAQQRNDWPSRPAGVLEAQRQREAAQSFRAKIIAP